MGNLKNSIIIYSNRTRDILENSKYCNIQKENTKPHDKALIDLKKSIVLNNDHNDIYKEIGFNEKKLTKE